MEVGGQIRSSSNLSDEIQDRNENYNNKIVDANVIILSTKGETENQIVDNKNDSLTSSATDQITQKEEIEKTTGTKFNRIRELSEEEYVENAVELHNTLSIQTPKNNAQLSDAQNLITNTFSGQIVPGHLPAPNNDIYKVALDGCTKNHIGSNINAANVTIVNNYDNCQTPEPTILKNKDKYNCIKSKLSLFLLTLLIIFTILAIEMFNAFVLTDDIYRDETQGVISTTTRSDTNSSKNESTLPQLWYVSREKWGGKELSSNLFLKKNVKAVHVSQTNTESCSSIESCSIILKNVQQEHINNSKVYGDDINYNFMIGDDGRIYEGRGWDSGVDKFYVSSGHYIVVSFIGGYQLQGRNTTQNQKEESFITFLEHSVSLGHLHKDYLVCTHCCVDHAYVKFCDGTRIVKSLQRYTDLYPRLCRVCMTNFRCIKGCKDMR